MNTLELFERQPYAGYPEGHFTCSPPECFVARTERFVLTVYYACENTPHIYGYWIAWGPTQVSNRPGGFYRTRLEAMEAGLEEVRTTLGWKDEELRQFILDEQILRVLGRLGTSP